MVLELSDVCYATDFTERLVPHVLILTHLVTLQDREEIRKQEKQDREDRKLAKKYGNCANGERYVWV